MMLRVHDGGNDGMVRYVRGRRYWSVFVRREWMVKWKTALLRL